MTPRAPSWAFFLLPTRMGELLAGALLAVLGTQVRAIPAAVRGRARVGRPGRHRRRLRPLRRDDAVARHRRPRAGAGHDGGDRRRIGHADPVGAGAGAARQRSAVGRAALLRAVPVALAGARARRSPLGPARLDRAAASRSALAVGLSALSFRFVEDPVRHARWLAAVPARSLALGAAMVLVMLTSGWALARSIPAARRRRGGGHARARRARRPRPHAGRADGRPRPRRRRRPPPPRAPAQTPDVDRATTTLPPLVAPDAPTGDLAGLVASMQQVLDHRVRRRHRCRPTCGPRSRSARDRALPYTQGCVNVGVNARLQPCEFGVAGARADDRPLRRLARRAVVRAAQPDRRAARLPAGAARQGRLPGHRRRRADAGAAPHLPAVPRRRDRVDRGPTSPPSSWSPTPTRSTTTTPRRGPRGPRRRWPAWPRSPRTSS